MKFLRLAEGLRLNAAVLMRALTVVLAGLLLLLGALAAHHAEAIKPEAAYLASDVMQDEHEPGLALGAEQTAQTSAGDGVLATLAAGCVVLAICCVIGLAILGRAQWAALLARYFGVAVPGRIRTLTLASFPSALSGPSLLLLSISRT